MGGSSSARARSRQRPSAAIPGKPKRSSRSPGSTGTATLRLVPPNEPAPVLASLRRLAREDPSVARLVGPERLAAALGEAWHGSLGRVGASPADLRAVFAAANREIWLWVMGNRTWAQLVEHLAGRAERHVTASEAGQATRAPAFQTPIAGRP